MHARLDVPPKDTGSNVTILIGIGLVTLLPVSLMVFCISLLSGTEEQGTHYKHSLQEMTKKSRQSVWNLEEVSMTIAGTQGGLKPPGISTYRQSQG